MSKVRVAVLRGGPSSEYEISLKTGAAVLEHLPEKYQGEDILISKNGDWHKDGGVISPLYVAHHYDVVWNALHGSYGEDGKVQHVLESLQVPFTGSKAYPSAAAMNKLVAKDYFRQHGIRTPYAVHVEKSADADFVAQEIFKKISPPWVVKPAASGSSLGITIARTLSQLVQGMHEAFTHCDSIFVEQYIKGREATCGVVDQFRGREHYALLPLEIIPPDNKEFFDYESKYDGTTEELCPGRFHEVTKRKIEELAVLIHTALGLRHYSRSDFIVTPRGIYALEVNTLPGLTTECPLPKALKAIGSSYAHFLDHVLTLALREKYQ